MIDFNAFFKYLWRYKWLVVAAIIISAVTTYFLAENLPDQYKSQAQIAAHSPQLFNQQAGASTGGYGDIAQMMQMRRVLNLLSYRLILHDLEHPSEAFRPFPEEMADWVLQNREELILEFKRRLYDKSILTIKDNQPLRLFDLVNWMGYGEGAFSDALTVEQGLGNNLTKVEFISENPALSVFAVNTLSSEFIRYYHTITAANSNESLQLLDSLLREKQLVMNDKNAQLQGYKSSSGVLNVSTQSGIAYQQVSEYESRLSQTRREIESLKGAIARINDRLETMDEQALNTNVDVRNNGLTQIDDKITAANKRYVDNGFTSEDKAVIDSLQRVRLHLLSAGSNTNRPVSTTTMRQSLIAERMQLETSLAMAEGSVPSIEQGLASARQKYSTMVPTDAGIQRFEQEAAVATQEYMDALNRYNQAALEKTAGLRLSLVEPGLPGLPEPSKRMLYVALSGLAGFSFLFLILFVAFLLDRRILNAQQLAHATNGVVIGNLNSITTKDKDLRTIWNDSEKIPDYTLYKDLLRSLRFEINRELSLKNHKVLGVTSLYSDEGKTFVTTGLAYAFAMTGKKVLLIGDGYSDLLDLIRNSKEEVEAKEFEKFLVKKEIKIEDFITVLNKNPNNTSLLELNEVHSLMDGFTILREKFDVILIDIDSLRDMNKVREWMMFVDKSIAVFASGNSIREEDAEFISFVSKHPSFMGWVLNKIPVKHKFQKLRARA